MIKRPSRRHQQRQTLDWHEQITRAAQSLCDAVDAATWGIVLVEQSELRFVGLAHQEEIAALWESLVQRLPLWSADDQTTLVDLGTHDGLVIVARALVASGRLDGYVLLALRQAPADTAPICAAVDLLDHVLRHTRQSSELSRRIAQLERQQAVRLREIKNSRNYLRGIIDNISLGLVLLDPDGTIRAINSSLARRFGREPADLVGCRYADSLGAWAEAPAAQTLSDGQTTRQRLDLVQSDGSHALLEISSFPLLDADGTIQRAVEVWDDITERATLQHQLVRAEKLAAIGQMAASVAHEVGNPLQAVQGFIALFLESCPPDTANRYYLQVAEQEIERVARVVARLRDFYRPSVDVLAPVQLNDLLSDVLLLTSKQLQRGRIEVVRKLSLDLPLVLGVDDQLKQVMLNLILNAIEAMPDGGTLTILSRMGQLDRLTQREHDADLARGSSTVEVVIADSGTGITPDQVARLFDGLRTTKASGMGLGLYTSKAIIDRHMGRIIAESAPGQGTTFTIVLPAQSEEIAQ